MADYFTQSVVQPNIPYNDLTPIERLLLSLIFEAEEQDDGLYFFTETGPADSITLNRQDLEEALAAAEQESSLSETIRHQLAAHAPDETIIELDLSGHAYENIFHDIVRRSATLRYVTILSAFTCSKMRSDGFGGAATLITADAILGKSTTDILEDFLVEAGLDQIESAPSAKDEAGHA